MSRLLAIAVEVEKIREEYYGETRPRAPQYIQWLLHERAIGSYEGDDFLIPDAYMRDRPRHEYVWSLILNGGRQASAKGLAVLLGDAWDMGKNSREYRNLADMRG